MASIHKEFIIDAPVQRVWEALREVGAVHERLVPGVLVNTIMEGDTRTVTFANGLVVREKIVDVDEECRRVAYSASGAQLSYHHASMQAIDDGDGRCRFVWITDLQPDSKRETIAALVDMGSETIARTLTSCCSRL